MAMKNNHLVTWNPCDANPIEKKPSGFRNPAVNSEVTVKV